MAPPGRRRSSRLSPWPVCLLALLLFTSAASAASAVLGVDLGTEYIKATLVKPGIPLEIVLSRDSKRKEAVAVAFKPSASSSKSSAAGRTAEYPERLYGSDALALAARRPDDVYLNMKQLLGLDVRNSVVGEYQRRYPGLEVVPVEGRNTVGFVSPSFDKLGEPFGVEEILAMELRNVRDNAQQMAGKGYRIENAVFTVPSFYTAAEKRAVQMAAELAGFRVLGMVTDGLAVGIQYATTRTFPSINEAAKDGTIGKPEHHVVFDMGAGSTTATVLKMQGRTVKDVGRFNKTIQEVIALSSSWDQTLGGDALNTLIRDDMVAQFVGGPAAKAAGVALEKVKAHGRANSKLWKEAERLRQVLSANQDASAGFESLYDDVDFRYKLSRTQFEKMVAGYLERIERPLNEALDAAELKVADIDSIILHGGLTRTPVIQKKLESLVGTEKLKSNVNADEAAVFGAAFKGAGLSPSFRVKEIRDTDVASYPAGITYNIDGKEKSQKLFTATSAVGATKLVTLKTLSDLEFSLFQQLDKETAVVKIQTTNLTDSVKQLVEKHGCSKDDISTKFGLRLDPATSLPSMVHGTVSCEVEDAKKDSIAGKVGGLFGFGAKKDKQEVLDDVLEGDETSLNAAEPSEKGATSTSSGTIESSSAAAEKAAEPVKKRKEIVHIGFTATPLGAEFPTGPKLKAIEERLVVFDTSDAARTQRSDILNNLEGLTYRIRDWLEDAAFTTAASASEQSTLKQLAKQASEWIYGDGAHATTEQLKEKLKGLTSVVDPIKARKDDAAKRPEQLTLLRDTLKQTKSMLDLMRESIEEAAKKAEAEAAAALSQVSDSASSAASAASEQVSSAAAGEESSPTKSAEASASSSSAASFLPSYTADDVSAISSIYDSVKDWLDEKVSLQSKLKPSDDPAVRSTDIEAKARELNSAIMSMLQKKMKQETPRPKKPKPSKAKSKTKSKTKKGKASADPEASSAADAAEPSPPEEPSTSVAGAEGAKETHDEL